MVKFDGLSQDTSKSNEIQFHFTNDPNFTARKDAFLMAKQEAEMKIDNRERNHSDNFTLALPPVQASAEEVYHNLYGNPGNL